MRQSTEFKLFAPRNQAATLIGLLNDSTEMPMEKGDDGYFRSLVTLEDGIYYYKFRVMVADKWVEINDPYMTAMNSQTETAIVQIKNGQFVRDTYVWKQDNHPLPANQDLVIYEMHIADFVGGEIGVPDKFKQATQKLDYLVALGINAIELLPITEYAGDYRWGYLVRYFFALESSYGTPEDFKHFVDECHARGIRVIIDAIFNHTDEQCPLLAIDRDYWYYHDRHYPDDDANYWGPELNYDNYDEHLDIKPAWIFIRDVVRYWIEEYHIDGIRYDAIRQLANYEFFTWLIEQANEILAGKPFYHIAEHIPDTSEIVKPNGCFDACWHESFRFFLKDALLGQKIDWEGFKAALAPQKQGYTGVTATINYLATHDREHILVELQDKNITGETAWQRVKLGVALQMTVPGVPLIWMGDEFGENCHKSQNTTTPNPIHWELRLGELNQDLWAYYQHIIALRKTHPALQTDNIEFFADNSQDKVLAYVRWDETGARLVVVANLSDRFLPNYSFPHFPLNGSWKDWLDGSIIEAKESSIKLDLPAYSSKILLSDA